MVRRSNASSHGGGLARVPRPEDYDRMVSERVTLAYDTVAGAYAERNAAMPPALIDLGQQVLARVGVRARILDVGCGAGRDMAWLERQGARTVGVDRSAGMLWQARAHVRGDLARMDMRALALRARRFDAVWCVASLLHLPKADAAFALKEMRRVLKEGGTLALALQEGAGEGWETGPYPEIERYFARYSSDEAEALLVRTGFNILDGGIDETADRRWLRFLAAPG